jgi:cyclophilin family peptidyl-prolyl cis-trans isomerase/HEAT repeat protein
LALLLLLEDRRLYEAGAVRPLLNASPKVRARLALTLGRVGDRAAAPDLEFLLQDEEVEVRRAAAFGLGLLAATETRPALLRAAMDRDEVTGRLSVEALAKQGAELPDVQAALAGLVEEQRWRRLLPSLFRFNGSGVVEPAAQALEAAPPEVRFWAAYALSRRPQAQGLPHVRRLLSWSDPWVRAQAARALGWVGEAEDVATLGGLLEDSEPAPVIHALRSLRRLVEAGKTSAPPAVRSSLLRLFEDQRPGVAETAIEASSAWLLDAALSERLVRLTAGGGRSAEAALAALATAGDPAARPIALSWSQAPAAELRSRAVEAATRLGLEQVVQRLANDPSAVVRSAALAARLAPERQEADRLASATAGLRDPDPVVRATAIDYFFEHPSLTVPDLVGALGRAARDEMPDARLAAIRCLLARAQAVIADREAVVAVLAEVAGGTADYLVRREAVRSLGLLEAPAPNVGSASARDFDYYQDVVGRTRVARRVDLRTTRGVVRVELDCPQAPLTCLNFLQLAAQGFYDGLRFHRVVPDFVAQAGDPRGDGSGGPGYEIRDEINPLRYERGAVGMALSGPDTGGSQFFILLDRAPHLDGGYTIFGRVVEGMDVADRLIQGDRIETASVLPAAR